MVQGGVSPGLSRVLVRSPLVRGLPPPAPRPDGDRSRRLQEMWLRVRAKSVTRAMRAIFPAMPELRRLVVGIAMERDHAPNVVAGLSTPQLDLVASLNAGGGRMLLPCRASRKSPRPL